MIHAVGYDLLGTDGNDGIRCVWKKGGCGGYVESAAFINRRKGTEDGICGYTASVSAGCILNAFHMQCAFCRTGNRLPFGGLLPYTDIAKQNVFMVMADMDCADRPDLALRQREFAYMGQGEPGYSYVQVRMAIELTNRIMDALGQKVYRHIFATCGIPEAMQAYREDIAHFYTGRVTLHFSLHATERRDMLMPVNRLYPYRRCVDILNQIYGISGEKPCVGILLLKDFAPNGKGFVYTNTYQDVARTLSELDPQKCRISFCEYNGSEDVCSWGSYTEEEAVRLMELADGMGFEAKLFSSFGREEQTACGMLGGKGPDAAVPDKWRRLEEETDRLIEEYR